MQYRPRLDEAERQFDELTTQMADPAIINDPQRYRKIAKARNDLAEIVGKYGEWKSINSQLEDARPMLTEADKKETLVLPTVMIGAFLLGVIVNAASWKLLKGAEGMPPWYQDVQAWVSVLAVLGLGAQVILELVIFPSMAEPPKLPQLQIILSSVIAFYFGARS